MQDHRERIFMTTVEGKLFSVLPTGSLEDADRYSNNKYAVNDNVKMKCTLRKCLVCWPLMRVPRRLSQIQSAFTSHLTKDFLLPLLSGTPSNQCLASVYASR
eukprot:Blabericola_migrator_1__6332@NODE_3197_length_1955_cov_8_902542_g2000_i0_p4_GENE_NODE_3197_length_1955_cov_8_902542_g2000_i0NODE_3197_length_1955_cov_8_902542_g2000_i0_p4_ORF_typecomplete_len102_score5_97_NODE_3197_length_1955_cov_8_902542_g2000_i016501955